MATKKTVQAEVEVGLKTPGMNQTISDWEKLERLIKSLPELLSKAGGGTKELKEMLGQASAAFAKGGGINGLQDQVKVLSGLLKSMGTITKAAEAVMPKEQQTKTQTEALREFAKAMREASQAAEEFQRQRQVKAGTFGMDSTTLKGVDAAIKKIQGDLLATKQMIDTLGLDKRKTVSDPIVAHGAQLGRNLKNLEGLRSGIVSSNYANALELDRQRDIVRAQTEKAELERAQKKKEAAEQEKKTSQTRQASAAELVKINAESDKLDAEIDQRKRKAAIKDAKDKKDKADRYVRGREADDIKEFGIQGVLRARGEDGRYVAAQNTTRLARGEGFNAFVQKGADSDRNTLLAASGITPVMLKQASDLLKINKDINLAVAERKALIAGNKGEENAESKALGDRLQDLIRQARKLKEDRARKTPEEISDDNKLREGNRAEGMMARVKGQGGAALFAVQATLIANYGLLQGFLSSGRAAITTSVELEAAFKNIQAVTATTATEMVGLQDKIKEVAATSKFSAIEVAQAALVLGQAGLSAKETGQAIESVVRLATASGTSLAQAVDLVTSVVGVFDKDVTDTADIANKITQAANSSKVSVDKLALGLQYAGNIASQSGVSFEETTAAMAAMSNAGIKSGSTMGTGLRQFLIEVQKPSQEFLTIMKQLGLNLSDIDIKAKGLVGVVTTLREAGFTASEAIKSFDVRGAAAFNALLADPAALQRQYDGLLNTKAALAANDIQMDSLQSQTKRLTTALGNMASAGLEPVSEVLKRLFSGFADVIQAMSRYAPLMQVLSTATVAFIGVGLLRHFVDIGAGAVKLMGLNGALATSITGLSTATVGSAFGLTATAAATTAAGAAATTATPAVGLLTRAYQGLMATLTGMSLLSGIGIALVALSAAYMGISYAMGSAKREMDRLTASSNDAKAAYDESNKAVTSITKKLEELEYKQANLDKGMRDSLKPILQELQSEFGKLGFQSEGVNGVWAVMIDRLKKVRDGMKEVADTRLSTQLAIQEKLRDEAKAQAAEAIKGVTKRGSGGGPDLNATLAGEFNRIFEDAKLRVGKDVSTTELDTIKSSLRVLSNPKSTDEEMGRATPGLQNLLAKIRDPQLTSRAESLGVALNKLDATLGTASKTASDAEETRARINNRASVDALAKAPIFNGRTLEQASPSTTELGSMMKVADPSVVGVDRFRRIAPVIKERIRTWEWIVDVLDKQIAEGGVLAEGAMKKKPEILEKMQKEIDAGKAMHSQVKKELEQEMKGRMDAAKNTGGIKSNSNRETGENKASAAEKQAAIFAEYQQLGAFGRDAEGQAKSDARAEAAQAKAETDRANAALKASNANINQRISTYRTNAESFETMAKATKAEALNVDDLEKVGPLMDKGIELLIQARGEKLKALALEQKKRVDDGDIMAGTPEFQKAQRDNMIAAENAAISTWVSSFKEVSSSVAKRLDRRGFKTDMRDYKGAYDLTKFQGETDLYEAGKDTRGLELEVASGNRQAGDSVLQKAKIKEIEVRYKGLTDELVALGTMSSGWLADTFVAFEDAKKKREELEELTNSLRAQAGSKGVLSETGRFKVEGDLVRAEGELKQAQTLETEALAAFRTVSGNRRNIQLARDEVQRSLVAQKEGLPQETSLENINKQLLKTWENYKQFVKGMDVNKTLGTGLKSVLEGMTSSLSTFFTTVVSRTATAKEAFRTMAVSMIKSMMDILSQALAMQAIKSLFGAFLGGSSTSTSTYSLPPMGASPGPGALIRAAKGGPVKGGIPGKDSVGILAMPGEFVLRKSAADAVGEDFLNSLNHETKATVSSSAGPTSSLKSREPDTTNIWIVAPEAKPTMGPKDVVMVITDDMLKGGVTKKLIQQIQTGAM